VATGLRGNRLRGQLPSVCPSTAAAAVQLSSTGFQNAMEDRSEAVYRVPQRERFRAPWEEIPNDGREVFSARPFEWLA
jgi:hypothetical protein